MGASVTVTVSVVVAGAVQAPVGVKVRAMGPLNPEGINCPPETPGPDHSPATTPAVKSVERFRGPPLLHTLAVPRVGVAGAETEMVVVADAVHGLLGVNVRVLTPPNP